MAIRIRTDELNRFVSQEKINNAIPRLLSAVDMLENKSGEGSDMLGWLNLPVDYDKAEFDRIVKASEKIKKDSDVLIVIGIGGSYLGARAAIQMLCPYFYNKVDKKTPDIFFAGNTMSSSYMKQVLDMCDNAKNISVNVISKSGETTEPAVAFRIFKQYMEKRYGKEKAKERIYVTTSANKGLLIGMAKKEGYETFNISDDIGGRYSVLTACGLLPIAACGVDIKAVMEGARAAYEDAKPKNIEENSCYKYALLRNVLHDDGNGKAIEVLSAYEPKFYYFTEWFKQLYGESEGKDGKGIFPSAMLFTTDLHSLGQYMQDGTRNVFETSLIESDNGEDVAVPHDNEDTDRLNILSGKTYNEINRLVYRATTFAHIEGAVPSILLEIDKADAFGFGYMAYFFEKACAVSGYILDVNPFNQNGVEDYKNAMYVLLGKKENAEMKEKLDNFLK